MGLAGCSSGDSTDDETEEETTTTTTTAGIPTGDDTVEQTTQPSEPTATEDGNDGTGGCQNPGACPMLPGSFTRFDPGTTPLPVSFEYPSVMSDNIDFASDFEQSNGVLGRLNRCTEDEFDGDIELGIDMDYNPRSQPNRDNWYQTNKSQGLEVFATTDLSGETVEFLWDPDGLNSNSNGSYTTSALIPYDGETGTTYHLTEVGVGLILLTSDVDTVTDTCDDNVRTTVEMVVESLQTNPETTFGQYVGS